MHAESKDTYCDLCAKCKEHDCFKNLLLRQISCECRKWIVSKTLFIRYLLDVRPLKQNVAFNDRRWPHFRAVYMNLLYGSPPVGLTPRARLRGDWIIHNSGTDSIGS